MKLSERIPAVTVVFESEEADQVTLWAYPLVNFNSAQSLCETIHRTELSEWLNRWSVDWQTEAKRIGWKGYEEIRLKEQTVRSPSLEELGL